MQIVAADVGNSSIKFMVADCEGSALDRDYHVLGIQDIEEDRPLLLQGKRPWLVSSVNAQVMQQLKQYATRTGVVDSWHVIDHQQIPLEIDLPNPAQVGIDRVLAGLAAFQLYGNGRDTIVVDCGTAMTIDFVKSGGTFCGGVIMAGPTTNLRALNVMTAALPDLSGEKLVRPKTIVGKSTSEAMLGGAWFSGLGAIREVVNAMKKQSNGSPAIVGTGGGLGPWKDELPADWILVDDLVLEGIAITGSHVLPEATNEPKR